MESDRRFYFQIMKEIRLELIYALIFWRLISIPMKKEKAEH
jgi:hypothetical protein